MDANSPLSGELLPGEAAARAAAIAEACVKKANSATLSRKISKDGKAPPVDRCARCNKVGCCLFAAKSKFDDQELFFCTESCVQQYFPKATIQGMTPAETVDDEPSSPLEGMVMEPEIEIQTSSEVLNISIDDSATTPSIEPVRTEDPVEQAARSAICCGHCKTPLYDNKDTLLWEASEFCTLKCLHQYMISVGKECQQCRASVSEACLGKLCVRFGSELRQFCSAPCLERFKAFHKLCSQCQINIPKSKPKNFCSDDCQELLHRLTKNSANVIQACAVCHSRSRVFQRLRYKNTAYNLCSEPCRNAFRFANKMVTVNCSLCATCFDVNCERRLVTRTADQQLSWYCNDMCLSGQLLQKRGIVHCARCQVKKYNVDMICFLRDPPPPPTAAANKQIYFCSCNCLSAQTNLGQSVNSGASAELIKTANEQDAAKVAVVAAAAAAAASPNPPPLPPPPVVQLRPPVPTHQIRLSNPSGGMVFFPVRHKVVTVPKEPKEMKNKSVWCATIQHGSGADPAAKLNGTESFPTSDGGTQTDLDGATGDLPVSRTVYVPIPIPVPIFVPVPMGMYSFPCPKPFAYPLPIPVPFLLPVAPHLVAEAMETMRILAQSSSSSTSDAPEAMDVCAVEKDIAGSADGDSTGGLAEQEISPEGLTEEQGSAPEDLAEQGNPEQRLPEQEKSPESVAEEQGSAPEGLAEREKSPEGEEPVPEALAELGESLPEGGGVADAHEVQVPDELQEAIHKLNEELPDVAGASGNCDPHLSSHGLKPAETLPDDIFAQDPADPAADETRRKRNSSEADDDNFADAVGSPQECLTPNTSGGGGGVGGGSPAEDFEQLLPAATMRMNDTAADGRKRRRSAQDDPAAAMTTTTSPAKKSTLETDDLSPAGVEAAPPNAEAATGDDSCCSEDDSPLLLDFDSIAKAGEFKHEIGEKAWSRWAGQQEKRFHELSVQEMSTSLSEFVRQVRRPDGEQYRPDVVLYFIYGLQETLNLQALQDRRLLLDEGLREFQVELDGILKQFYDVLVASLGSGGRASVTSCLKEEFLFDCQQLGVQSPLVLVFTMVYFNTKFFRLYTVEQHEKLSFSSVRRVSRKGAAGKVSSVQLVLPVYQRSVGDGAIRNIRERLLEQPENTSQPRECPVNLHRFYLDKCPASVRKKDESFYLAPLCCSPGSTLWYSPQKLPREMLAMMLHRVLLVQEVLRGFV